MTILASPSIFEEMTKQYPGAWYCLKGLELTHNFWGVCKVEEISLVENCMTITRYDLDMDRIKFSFSGFKDEYFAPFALPNSLEVEYERIAPHDLRLEEEGNNPRYTEFNLYTFVSYKNEDSVTKLRSILELPYQDHAKHLDDIRKPETELTRPSNSISPARPLDSKTRAELIKKSCENNNIYELFHFTRIENMDSISERGLISQRKLEELPAGIRPRFNDLLRFDKHPEASSLSISFPNSQMFFKFRYENLQQIWVVLILKSSILWELDCAFCVENAASSKVSKIVLDQRKTFLSFKSMFRDYPEVARDQLNIPVNYPIHPQAEVLVFDRIDPAYIKAVHINPEDFGKLKGYPIKWIGDIETRCDKRFFEARCDWQFWKNR